MLQAAIRDRPRSSFATNRSSPVMDSLAEHDYSLARVLLGERGYEGEISQEMARVLKRQPAGIFVPSEVLAVRDLSAGTPTSGGVSVELTVQKSLIPVLRNQSVCAAMGATVFENLRGNVSIPRQTQAATGQWLAENAALTQSDQTFDQVGLSPKRISGSTRFSTSLLRQSSLEVEAVVRNDLVNVLATALDAAVLTGTGPGNNQPLGILNYPSNPVGVFNVTKTSAGVTFGGAATWGAILDLEYHCESGNIQRDGTGGYVSSPASKRKMKAAQKVATFPEFIWESVGGQDYVNGYRALASNQLSSTNQVIFSPRWSDVIIGIWPAFDLVVDRLTRGDANQIIVTVNLLADATLRYGLSFAASTDAGNQ